MILNYVKQYSISDISSSKSFEISGTGILPNSLLHLKRWGNHLHSYRLTTNSSETQLPEFNPHQSISTLQEALEIITGKT